MGKNKNMKQVVRIMEKWGLPLILVIGVVLGFSAASLLTQHAECETCLIGSAQPVFSPGSEEEIIGLIDSANESVEVEMFLFSYEPLADALIRAKERGVEVRVILEPRLDSPNYNLETMDQLRAGGVEARWATLEYDKTHSKLMIVDGKKVLVGSINWSRTALNWNREAAVIIDDEGIAAEFLEEFEKDWDKATTQANS